MFWKLRQGKYGAVSRVAYWTAIALSTGLVASAVIGWYTPLAVALALSCLLFVQVAIIYMLGRAVDRVSDLQAALSLEQGLTRAGYAVKDFFTDEAAATPTLQLVTLKILLFCQPKRVLEIGSGQTTKLLSNYARQNLDAYVLSIEQDETWARRLGPQVFHNYLWVPCEPTSFTCDGTEQAVSTTWFRDLPELKSEPFQFILVDGPDYDQVDAPFYRGGILRYLPAILDDTFVLVFDDAERLGDSMTVEAVDAILRAKSIDFRRFSVYGSRTVAVFCSRNLGFLRTV